MKCLRLSSLLVLLGLVVLLAIWRSGRGLEYWPRPTNCSAAEPAWLEGLADLSGELGWPGFQLSYIDPQGARVDCAVGWAGFLWPMRTDHVMRYASLSKLFTSLVMVQLFSEKHLYPDDLLVARLGVSGPFADSRVAQITLEQLLRHTAGFDRLADPMLASYPWCPERVEALRDVQLEHVPGRHYAYSNLGYCLLGAVIARSERESLEAVYRRRLLKNYPSTSIAPIRYREIRAKEPERYFESPESSDGLLSLNYESLMAVGTWAGTAQDLLGLMNDQFEGGGGQLLEVPQCDPSIWRGCHGPALYAYRQAGEQLMYWRDGSLPGVSAFVGIFKDGSKIVVLANGRHLNWMDGSDRLGQAIYQWLR